MGDCKLCSSEQLCKEHASMHAQLLHEVCADAMQQVQCSQHNRTLEVINEQLNVTVSIMTQKVIAHAEKIRDLELKLEEANAQIMKKDLEIMRGDAEVLVWKHEVEACQACVSKLRVKYGDLH